MSYTFVGYQVVDNHSSPTSSVTIDLSALTGGTRQANDLAIAMPFSVGVPAQTDSYNTPSGWNDLGSFLRNPTGSKYQGEFFQKQLTGSETTVTFTDANSRNDTEGALVAVYRGISPSSVPPSIERDPSTSSTLSTPWTAGALISGSTGTSDVTCTIASSANSLGAIRQQLIYLYLDAHGPGAASIVRSSTDSNLIERFTFTQSGLFFAWFDELWESSSAYPSRAVSTHWSSAGNSYYGHMERMRSTTDQSIVGAGADHWAHAEGSDDMDSWQLVG